MAMTLAQYETLMENIEQVITARNTEEYLAENPEAEYPPPPDPAYDVLKLTTYAQLLECLGDGASVVAERLTTGSNGKATITFPAMTTPVVTAAVVDATVDNTYYQVVIESLTTTSAVVRVTQNSAVTVLGISVLSVPSAADGASVHVIVADQG